MNISRLDGTKTEVMRCIQEFRIEVVLSDKKKDILTQVETFKYLGSISENGGCEEEVRHRVGAGWGKRLEMSGIVCDKRMSIILKAAVYKTDIRTVWK